jgi:hypothetical protein
MLELQSPSFSFPGFSMNAGSDSKDTDDRTEVELELP